MTGGHRGHNDSAWHRQQLRAIYGSWRDQTPLEAVLPGRGVEALEGWAAHGQMGSSKWPKHRGEVIDEEQWEAMIQDLKERQRAMENNERDDVWSKRRRLQQPNDKSKQHDQLRGWWRQQTERSNQCSTL